MRFPEPFAPFAAGVLVIAMLLGGAIGVLTAPVPASDIDTSALVAGMRSLPALEGDAASRPYDLSMGRRRIHAPLPIWSQSSPADAYGQCGAGVWSFADPFQGVYSYRVGASSWLATQDRWGDAGDIGGVTQPRRQVRRPHHPTRSTAGTTG